MINDLRLEEDKIPRSPSIDRSFGMTVGGVFRGATKNTLTRKMLLRRSRYPALVIQNGVRELMKN